MLKSDKSQVHRDGWAPQVYLGVQWVRCGCEFCLVWHIHVQRAEVWVRVIIHVCAQWV